jgi:hypothetical protein
LNNYDCNKIITYFLEKDEYHPEYESFNSYDEENYDLFNESMYLIPDNFEIIRKSNDEAMNLTTF